MNSSLEYINGSVMGWGNRGWLEIIDFILETCKSGSLKTHIMYRCNLNSKQVERYLEFLLRCKLLERNSPSLTSRRYVYKTTEHGRRYLSTYKQLQDIFNSH